MFRLFYLYITCIRKEKHIMGRSLIQTTNQSQQTVANNSIVSLGSVQRRYGCNLRLSGNGIEIMGDGYYEIDCNVSVTPTAAGPVTVALYNNDTQIPGAIAYGTVTAVGDSITLPLLATVRQGCCCDGSNNITCVLIEGAGVVRNISMRIVKS